MDRLLLLGDKDEDFDCGDVLLQGLQLDGDLEEGLQSDVMS